MMRWRKDGFFEQVPFTPRPYVPRLQYHNDPIIVGPLLRRDLPVALQNLQVSFFGVGNLGLHGVCGGSVAGDSYGYVVGVDSHFLAVNAHYPVSVANVFDPCERKVADRWV